MRYGGSQIVRCRICKMRRNCMQGKFVGVKEKVKFDKSVLVEQICEPVRNVERIAVMELIRTPAGEPVYDFGQNLAGVVVFPTPGDFDGTLKLQFAEILVMLTARLWNLFIGGSRGSNA